jgi:hypothetical protein
VGEDVGKFVGLFAGTKPHQIGIKICCGAVGDFSGIYVPYFTDISLT